MFSVICLEERIGAECVVMYNEIITGLCRKWRMEQASKVFLRSAEVTYKLYFKLVNGYCR